MKAGSIWLYLFYLVPPVSIDLKISHDPLFVGEDVFGRILVFLKKVSLITRSRKVEKLDSLFSIELECRHTSLYSVG